MIIYAQLVILLTTIAKAIIYLFCYLKGEFAKKKIYYVSWILNIKSIVLDDNTCIYKTCITFNNYCQNNQLIILLFNLMGGGVGFVTKKEEKILCILDTKT